MYDNTLTCTNATNLSNIYCELLACGKSNSCKSKTCPPVLCTNSAEFSNSSNFQVSENEANAFSSQDENYFPFYRIYKKIRYLRQTVVANVLVGISALTRFVI